MYRLIKRLNDGKSYFFLHVDKKVSIERFEDIIYEFEDCLILVERVSIEWAGFGLVQATLNAMRQIAAFNIKIQWIVLLSGQDYPVKPNEYINQVLSITPSSAFFDYTKLPDYERWSPRGGYYRIDKYFLGLKKQNQLAAKSLNFLAAYLPFLRRNDKNRLKPYAGSQWWMMNDEMLCYVLRFVADNPLYSAFHQYTFAPDEVFFHTIVLNATDELTRTIENDSKRFMVWPDTSKPHPEVLKRKDLHAILSSNALFARKFDISYDDEILNLIDEHCLNVELSNYFKPNLKVGI